MNSSKIDLIIKAPSEMINGVDIDYLRLNSSKHFFDNYNSKFNIIEFSNGRKIAIKKTYTLKGNCIKTSYLEIYYIKRIENNKLYFVAYSKENKKGLKTFYLPYESYINL